MNQTQYQIIKLPIQCLVEHSCHLTLTEEEECLKGYLITQDSSLLLDQIERLRGYPSKLIRELILVEAKKNPKLEEKTAHILNHGFFYNGIHYLRFGKSASQGKDGITAFVSETIYKELYQITQLNIPVKECVISKYEAQRCLLFSSCTLIPQYQPRIIIIGEYEKELKDQWIRYVVEKERVFTDPDTGEKKPYIAKEIEEGFCTIKISPFDGCGCHEKEFMETVTKSLELDYEPIGVQVRYPFVKGYSLYVPFRKILKSMGISQLTDIYGQTHSIDEIDCIWNTSMFKGHKLFLNAYGSDAWKQYMAAIHTYQFKLGISKYSHHIKNGNKKARLNFQYLQCLDLWNPNYIEHYKKQRETDSVPVFYDILSEKNKGKMISLASYTTSLYEKIIKGESLYPYLFLGITDTDRCKPESCYLEAILLNPTMLHDPAVRQFLYRKLKKAIHEAKLGKIYADGFYHTVVGDFIGYLQYAAGQEPTGCLKAHEFYTGTLKEGKALSLRSPLVCPSEVNEVRLVKNEILEQWFSYFRDQDVVMINLYDLSMPQQGGMDADGDAVFLTTDPLLVESKIQKPVIVDIEDKALSFSKPYTKENITAYEMNSRDNRIGEITNAATCIENLYTEDPLWKKRYEDDASLLRVYQGKEIDFLKTGLRWQMNKHLRNYLKRVPWFLLYNYPKKLKVYEDILAKNRNISDPKHRIPSNAYRSPSPMNELCEYINAWEKRSLFWDKEIADTSYLVLNHTLSLNDRTLMRQIRHLINEYSMKLKELFLILREKNEEGNYHEFSLLLETYKKKLALLCPDEMLLANYVIKVSYLRQSISKGLAWSGYGSLILQNIKTNSPVQSPITIHEVSAKTEGAKEYLGKYYLMQDQ